ncbi:hypothetical protein KVV02_008417 [Mortierella alpina]|uniref:Disintegrin domain-containing protein n=1 Tax=Mortierella alpina TaxID=64518 RepID=A0A9P8A8X2_MORAP|nr:hypothetical protein KVV02_008417 [Mortierella alpina]
MRTSDLDIHHAQPAVLDLFRRGEPPGAPHPHPHPKAAARTSSTAGTPPESLGSSSPLPVCGNGIIEHGEECDCGSPEECAKDKCCNAKTCKLAPGAVCSNQQDCCDKCQFRPATFICHPATATCGVAEMCTGKSAKCPANKKDCSKHHSSASNTTGTDAMCGSRSCTARDLQCQAQATAQYNFTTSCATDTSTCQVTCANPSGTFNGSTSCLALSLNFSDGTECGQGGTCTNGVCIGDSNNESFLKKNSIVLAISGAGVFALLLACFLSICCLRRRRRIHDENAKRQEDAYPMSENLDRRSNIRIGLDPPHDQGLVDVFSSYEKGTLTRRTSSGLQQAHARTGRSANGPYAPNSLMSEQDMALDLESDANQRLNPALMSNWPAVPATSRDRSAPLGRSPSHGSLYSSAVVTDKGWNQGLQSSGSSRKSPNTSNHAIYTPPPLPSSSACSSKSPGPLSPYADEAMIIFPPDSPPRMELASSSKNTGNLTVNGLRQPTTRAGETAMNGHDACTDDDDEPSFLQLDNSLTVDRCTRDFSSAAKDRASVSSFFSTLALDPEPAPPLPSTMPPMIAPMLPEPSFASEEFIIPAPVARIVPAPTPVRAGSRVHSSSSPNSPTSSVGSGVASPKQKLAYDRKQEEIKVAACFAQDLGFEIVEPSPTSSPRHKPATPTGSRRL